MDPVRQAIVEAARRSGIPPAVALAFAERESAFNPAARSDKTIAGLYQMQGGHRARYGAGDSLDPGVQTEGWARFAHDLRKEMAAALGRDPTWGETYLGHHFGGGRASRMLGMAPETPVANLFSPRELELNPHIGKAGTVGNLVSSTRSNMEGRFARHGEVPDFSAMGDPVEAPDFAAFGTPVN